MLELGDGAEERILIPIYQCTLHGGVSTHLGWCQTVANEGNARLILRLDPLIRSVLQIQVLSASMNLILKASS